MFAMDSRGLETPARRYESPGGLKNTHQNQGLSRLVSLSLRARIRIFIPEFINPECVTEEIHLEDETDRWRWVCPSGHRSWEPTNHHFWCANCARNSEADGVFYELRNKATGEVHDREQIRLLTPAGPYQDVHQEGSA
jgi:hypothetical protein